MHREGKKEAKKGSNKTSSPEVIHSDEIKKHDANKKNLK